MTDKIIIIRGNSGSGKTTVAEKLCKELGNRDIMLISQDVVRRNILHTADGENNTAIDLIIKLVEYGRNNSQCVILEGILNSVWYKPLFDYIKNSFSNIYAYYYDIPFDETVRRHKTKLHVDFNSDDMKRWWNEKDYLGLDCEVVLSERLSCDEVVELIFNDISHLD